MAAVTPFRALRYNPAVAGDLSAVLSPPYDVITPEQQARLYQASPYNVVRLILGTQSSSDTPKDNRYTRAARDYRAWQEQRVLTQDAEPALYLVEHRFRSRGRAQTRIGFFALLGLMNGVEQGVFRHEATLSGPKEDRTKLLEAVPANLEPIFCTYPDDGGVVQALLSRQTSRPPAIEALIQDEPVRVWAVQDRSVVDAVVRHLASHPVMIADGHHRFEVGLAGRARYGAIMAYFCSMADPALVVQPIHRIVEAPGTGNAQALSAIARVEPAADLAAVMRWLEASDPAAPGRFGLSDGQRCFTVAVTPEPLQRWLSTPSVPASIAALDVSVLHHLVLPHLGVPVTKAGAGATGVRYTAQAQDAVSALAAGQAGSAWFLRPILLSRVYEIAAQGVRLPPKSTYFYPKVPSGLAINPFGVLP